MNVINSIHVAVHLIPTPFKRANIIGWSQMATRSLLLTCPRASAIAWSVTNPSTALSYPGYLWSNSENASSYKRNKINKKLTKKFKPTLLSMDSSDYIFKNPLNIQDTNCCLHTVHSLFRSSKCKQKCKQFNKPGFNLAICMMFS